MKAVVIDFDNTLVKSDVNVIIRDKSGNETSIPSAEFYTYKLQPGEEYDFREFDQPVKNPKVILENFQTLLSSVESGSRTVILTARKEPGPIKEFLKYMGVKIPIEIVTLDSSSPNKR